MGDERDEGLLDNSFGARSAVARADDQPLYIDVESSSQIVSGSHRDTSNTPKIEERNNFPTTYKAELGIGEIDSKIKSISDAIKLIESWLKRNNINISNILYDYRRVRLYCRNNPKARLDGCLRMFSDMGKVRLQINSDFETACEYYDLIKFDQVIVQAGADRFSEGYEAIVEQKEKIEGKLKVDAKLMKITPKSHIKDAYIEIREIEESCVKMRSDIDLIHKTIENIASDINLIKSTLVTERRKKITEIRKKIAQQFWNNSDSKNDITRKINANTMGG